MKVLMFGWEFPPHISGGLGTACFGLTQALLTQKVKVLFVVPRLWGDERPEGTQLINASDVKVKRKNRKMRALAGPTGVLATPDEVAPGAPLIAERTGSSHFTYIDVPAGLSAYDLPPPGARWRHCQLTTWNYSMSTARETDIRATDSKKLPISNPSGHEPSSSPGDEGEYFMFSGSYGRDLLGEVHRYGTIGGILAEKYSFDLIHAHDWMTFEAGIQARDVSGKPLVIHVHSTEVDRAGENLNPAIFELERRGFMAADRIITVSHWTRQIVVTRYGIPEGKIRVVHNGILPRNQSPGLPFPEIGSHLVTFLGRVTHQKGPAFFVEAAAKVLQEFPEAHFIVAGAGDLLPQIIERVAQLNMSANFHFTGFLSGSEVDQVWSMTDVYVMPSVSEPFGIAPLEAIQGGVPVILSNQSGVSEVMPHAIKVDFWDVKALAAAICSVLRYESLSQVLRHHGRKHVEGLTWDKAAGNVKAVYDELRRKK